LPCVCEKKKKGARKMGKPRIIGMNKPFVKNAKADRKKLFKKGKARK
jgi:hypothetical protein